MLKKLPFLEKGEMLRLPKSVKSYILLYNYILTYSDIDIYCKLISEYLDEIPAFEIENILSIARIMLVSNYQDIVDLVFVH